MSPDRDSFLLLTFALRSSVYMISMSRGALWFVHELWSNVANVFYRKSSLKGQSRITLSRLQTTRYACVFHSPVSISWPRPSTPYLREHDHVTDMDLLIRSRLPPRPATITASPSARARRSIQSIPSTARNLRRSPALWCMVGARLLDASHCTGHGNTGATPPYKRAVRGFGVCALFPLLLPLTHG